MPELDLHVIIFLLDPIDLRAQVLVFCVPEFLARVLLVFLQYLGQRGGGATILKHLSKAGKDNKRDLGVAEHADLLRLLHDSIPSLREGYLPVC